MLQIFQMLLFLTALTQSKSYLEKSQNKSNALVMVHKSIQDSLSNYDFALNNTFFIGTGSGLKKYLSTKKYNQVNKTCYNTLLFFNKNKNQCCELQTVYFGRTEIRKILIYFYNNKHKKRKFFKTAMPIFSTNRSICLGISEKQFLKLSDQVKYVITNEGGYKIYYIDFFSMGKSNKTSIDNEIYGVYYFKKGKLKKIDFGYA